MINPNEPFLIAHKVRSEAAFDIAHKLTCPECHGMSCDECGKGHWWIIPTSGHRAYPYWECELLLEPYTEDGDTGGYTRLETSKGCWTIGLIPPLPPSLPDHYPTIARTSAPRPSALSALLASHRPSISRRGR